MCLRLGAVSLLVVCLAVLFLAIYCRLLMPPANKNTAGSNAMALLPAVRYYLVDCLIASVAAHHGGDVGVSLGGAFDAKGFDQHFGHSG